MLRENKIHGDAMFPLYVYVNEEIREDKELHCHWHEEVEFIYIEQGEAIFNIDMEVIKASKGECILVNSESLHSGYSINKGKCSYKAIVFDLNFLSSAMYDLCQSKFIDPIINKTYKFPKLIKASSEGERKVIDEIRQIIKVYCIKNVGWELMIKASLLKIVALIAESSKLKGEEKDINNLKDYKIELIKKTIMYIQLNYNKKIYIENLASEINMNTYYFCRFFKKIMGKTPIEYLNHYRIEQAARIIKNEDRKIINVALDVGFENLSYFIKKFKQYKKCTPAKFRKINLE